MRYVRPLGSTMTATGDPASEQLDRLPALDGVRAIAVYLVVVFHAGVDRFAGGFIGVDVFFVLSGFLITRLLLVEQGRTGRIELMRFYGRRIRRLLPAATVTLVVTCLLFVAFASPIERRAVLGDARAAAFYVANWNFINQGQDYFAADLESSPFLHLWSLSVEEQFYVVWPIAMIWIARWAMRSERARQQVNGGIVVLALGGAVFALVVADNNLIRAYYGTDTRAYQLLAGAAIAVALVTADGRVRHFLSPRSGAAVLSAGIVGVFAVALVGDVGPVQRGVLATVAAVAVVVGVAAPEHPTAPARILGRRPFVYLGVLSYGTYLWHWPVVIVLERTVVVGPTTTAVVVAVVATGLAKLSLDLVELPVRRRSGSATRRQNQLAIAAAVTTAFVVGLVVAPVILRSDVEQLRAADRPGYTPRSQVVATTPVDERLLEPTAAVPIPTTGAAPTAPAPAESNAVVSTTVTSTVTSSRVDEPELSEPIRIDGVVGANAAVVGETLDEGDGCVNDDFDDARSCIVAQGGGERLLLVGDSHANKLIVSFADYAVRNDLTLATVSMVACPWQRGLLYELVPPVEGARQVCRDQRATLYEDFARAYRPDVVVMMSHDLTSERYKVVPSDENALGERGAGLDLIRAASVDSIDIFTDLGARVVIVEPLPNAPFDPVICLDASDFVEECAFDVDVASYPPPDTLLYRELAAERSSVATVELSDLVCPAFPRCDAVVSDLLVREDVDHLSVEFTLSIADEVMARVGL